MCDEKNRGKGRSLPLGDLERLRELISEKMRDLMLKHDGAESVHDSEVFERYEKNPQDIKIRKELIDRIPKIDNWIRRLTTRMNADPRSVKKYVENPQKLDSRIEVLKMGGGKARVLRGEARQVFAEGVRLLSTTIDDLVKYIPDTYLPYNHPIFGVNDDRPHMDIRVSRSTFANEAKLCFDITGKMTIKQMMADKALQETIKERLRDWPSGTVGVHAVEVLWQMDHDGDITRMQAGKKGGKMTLLLMAERKPGGKEVAFSPFPNDALDNEKAAMVKEFLASMSTPTQLVCMTSELRNGQIVPTAMGRSALEEALGTKVGVELDVPTRGLGPIRVKGRHKSEDDLYKYLAKLLN